MFAGIVVSGIVTPFTTNIGLNEFINMIKLAGEAALRAGDIAISEVSETTP
jgi:hypothetical protein